MENLPPATQTPNINTNPNIPSRELVIASTNYPEFAEETPETVTNTTKITPDQWEETLAWVVGDPEAGKAGIPIVGDLTLMRKFGIDKTTATAIFEELQARNIVSRESIPTPGKGGVRGDGYDQTRFGGHIVLAKKVNSDGSVEFKDYEDHPELPAGPSYKPAPDIKSALPNVYKSPKKPGVIRAIGRGLTKGAVATTQSVAEFAYLKGYQVKDSTDYLSRDRSKREHDQVTHKVDRAYAKAFNENEGKPLNRTVPPLEIVSPVERVDPRSQAEREVDAEIEALRAHGEDDNTIKTTLVKRYHTDREDGGDAEKVRLVTNKFMVQRERIEASPNIPRPDIDQIIAEQNEAKKAAQEQAKSEEVSDEVYQIGIAYLAKGIGKKGQDQKSFTRMSPESFKNALIRRGADENEAVALYRELQDKGYIDKTESKDGYRVLKNRAEFQAILKDIAKQ